MRLSDGVVVAALLLSVPAMACPGQTGKTIYEDNFSDDSGGWNGSPPDVAFKAGSLLLRPNPRGEGDTSTSIYSEVASFAASNGDYCAEFVLPKAVAPDNDVAAGLFFWASPGAVGTAKKFLLRIYTDRTLILAHYSGDAWTTIFNMKADVPFEPEGVNSLRLVAKDERLTIYVNGQQIRTVRAQMPDGELHFGVYAADEKKSAADPVITFKSFKVTAGG